MNDFLLSPLEKKQIINDFNQLTSLQSYEISYYENSLQVGYGDNTNSNWSNFKEYDCTLEKISDLNIKRYPYGDVTEGDLIVLFPSNTNLPKVDKYRIKYEDKIYYSNTGLIGQDFLGDTILYYAMVFKL
ncbi:MAG: hypothetical protein ACOCRK_01285 [bacterium]